MNMFRCLRADEIDCRIAQIKEEEGVPKGLSILLYKDARCDQNILDETVGPFNWKREHTRDNRNCIVSLWDDKKNQWVGKEDTGTESNTEAAKGLASDSYKRACFNWGIGRELYSAPFVWIGADKCTIKRAKTGKLQCFDNFTVNQIAYDGGRIIGLKIKNEKTGNIVFNWGTFPEKTTNVNDSIVAPDNEPDPEPVVNADAPAQVTVQKKVPEANPVLNYINNERAFMANRLGITDQKEMKIWFATKAKALIEANVVPNVAADKMSMDQAKNLVEAIYKTYLNEQVIGK